MTNGIGHRVIAISRIFLKDQWKFLPWWLLSKSEYNDELKFYAWHLFCLCILLFDEKLCCRGSIFCRFIFPTLLRPSLSTYGKIIIVPSKVNSNSCHHLSSRHIRCADHFYMKIKKQKVYVRNRSFFGISTVKSRK